MWEINEETHSDIQKNTERATQHSPPSTHRSHRTGDEPKCFTFLEIIISEHYTLPLIILYSSVLHGFSLKYMKVINLNCLANVIE